VLDYKLIYLLIRYCFASYLSYVLIRNSENASGVNMIIPGTSCCTRLENRTF